MGDNITSPVGFVTKTSALSQDVSKNYIRLLFSCSKLSGRTLRHIPLLQSRRFFDFSIYTLVDLHFMSYAADGLLPQEKAVRLVRAPNANNMSEVISLAD